MRIIQITDSHISCDVPRRTEDLRQCIQAVNAVHPAPDLVIHTGDITHEGSAEEYQIARSLLDELKSPYAVLAGNKDKRPELKAAFDDNRYLKPACDDPAVGVSTDDGFIQFSIEQFSVRIIVLDTLGVASKGELCESRLQHLDTMLRADVTRPAVIFMHHSPFEVTEIPDPFQFANWADVEQLLHIIDRYKQVQSIYCGHVHRNINAWAGTVPVSALTCTACDLRKGQLSPEDRQRPMINLIDFTDS